jgi:ankyrin repeat protein
MLGAALTPPLIEFARMLLERGAVLDARCNEGRTPLYWAVQLENTRVVQLLLEHGADLNVCDKLGYLIPVGEIRDGIIISGTWYMRSFVRRATTTPGLLHLYR